jgi:enoyl-CoA hydratase
VTKSVFHAPRDAHPLIDDLAQAILFETDEKRDRMTTFLNRKKPD